MAGYGVPEGDIARVLDVPADYLREHFRKELDSGQIKANTKVAEDLYRKATGEGREAVTAAIFWLKTRAGWKETAVHEVSGRDGGPIETVDHSSADLAGAVLSIICRDAEELPRRIARIGTSDVQPIEPEGDLRPHGRACSDAPEKEKLVRDCYSQPHRSSSGLTLEGG